MIGLLCFVERLRRDAPKRADKAFRYGGPGRSHDSIPPRVGSAVALPCHLVRGVEGIGRDCQEHLAEKNGGSTLDVTTKVAKFFPPWTVAREVWHAALRPDVSWVRRGRPAVPRGRIPVG